MATIFIRSIIIYVFLLIAMRLMGKRQLGELQPFEFAITLIVADLACVPMSQTSIPISYGLIPIFTLFILHHFITKLSLKSLRFRKILNGKPVIIIDENGINSTQLNSVNMDVNDLLEAIRGAGYFNPAEIEYAILETSGKMSVLPKSPQSTSSPQIPFTNITYTLVCEGKILDSNLSKAGVDREKVMRALSHFKLKLKNILLFTLSNGESIYIQPYIGKYITDNLNNISSPVEQITPENTKELK